MASRQGESGSTTYIFGPFRFSPERQLLSRDGLPVRIGGRALDILTLLVRHPGDVVSKSELIAFCWPSTYVEESNLKVNVASLRKILTEGSEEPFIATVAGRGYRFVSHVQTEHSEPDPVRVAAKQWKPTLKPQDVIGRAEEIDSLTAMLRDTRCLTIVGSGGIGKTTVALALAHNVLADYAQGVSFIDMSTVGDEQYATAAIAARLGARQRSDDTLSELVALLHDSEMLLILDNCEHLSPIISSIVMRLLEALPNLRILATSREPLFIPSEQLYRLPGLVAPGPNQGGTATEAAEFSAVKLFVARASGRQEYTLNDADAPLVSAICRRLDGIPLAIELAASKTFAYGLPTLDAMLEQKFLLLSNGERTAPLRQQTLLATLDWSYRLLSEEEATLLRFLSVFAGRFRMEDAAVMAGVIPYDLAQTIDGIERLTSKSLICAEYQDGLQSYRLLESTRAFAAERLLDAGEHDDALRRHALSMLAVFEKAAGESESRDKGEWMAEYAHRLDDARNAMDWAFGPKGDRMLGIRLTIATIPLWYELSALNEMQTRVDCALRATRECATRPKELIMKLVAARASGLVFAQHLPLDTESAWRECYELAIEIGDTKYEIMGLWGLSSFLLYTGKPLEALAGLHRLVGLSEAQADSFAVDEAHRMMATAEIYIGEVATARQRLERLAARHRRLSDPARFARFHSERGVGVRCTLSLALWASGEPSRAMQVARAAVERAKVSGHVVSQWNALAVFSVPISFWSGDYIAAEEFLLAAEECGKMEDVGAWREVCRFFRSALRAKRQEPGAIAELKSRLKEMMEARQVLRAPMYHAMVAEALLDCNCVSEAQAMAQVAHSLAIQQDAHWCMPEIMRIIALTELQLGSPEKAEQQLGHAISKAASMGVLTLELRAALSLSIKLIEDGRDEEAHDLLNTICAKFPRSESFADLTRARGLLLNLCRTGVDIAASA
ncbi:ATP-binding protein [Neorhizobium alkalisoli]|uniref:Putative ATPase n=1 Tax=Neorhizobium alkalisoli TaxID=528178 RepID=A0A561R916_9HYPH|nr:winged helix-turn-helix domain-containing protein [Neorhizobium alkalisoli]TWF59084.1 putative ATPase [Neorhizobium alkalisoli]